MEPLIHTPSDTDPGLPRLVTPDRNHVLDLRGREGVTDYGLDSMYRTGLMKGVRAVDLGYCERITDDALVLHSGIDTLTRLYLDGCWRITARASIQAAATAGGCEVENRKGRARWVSSSRRAEDPAT